MILTINYRAIRGDIMRLEAKIGLFVVVVLTALLTLSTQVTNIGKWGDSGYIVYAYIDDASGVEKQTNVSMNGVVVGSVKSIEIEKKRVKLALMINHNISIPLDSSVIVAQESLLGSKVINIIAGDDDSVLVADGVITESKQYASFDQTSDSINSAAKELELLIRDFRATLDDEHRRAIQEMIVAFRDVGVGLDGMISDNRANLYDAIYNFKAMSAKFGESADTINSDLPEIMARINSLTTRLDNISGSLEHSLPEAVDKFIAIEDNVSDILAENRSSLKSTLSNASEFFKSGEEAFNKVDNMLSSFTESELQMFVNSNYMSRDSYAKTYLGINYLPNPSTYYMFNVVSGNDFRKSADGIKRHEKAKTYYSLQYGKRFDDLLLRFGAIESTGGVGFDYYTNNDRLVFSGEAFDFNSQNDIRNKRAHLKAQMRYQALKHLELYAGWDNFLNPKAQNFYMGLGLRFIDHDLKYAIGAASVAK